MSKYEGGCLCGRIRYELAGFPQFAGYCYCSDCRKASGSGYIPFMGFEASAMRLGGRPSQYRSRALSGNVATRNFCAACGSLLFGGDLNTGASLTIYAGSLDNPELFEPSVGIFECERAKWVLVPNDIVPFRALPGQE